MTSVTLIIMPTKNWTFEQLLVPGEQEIKEAYGSMEVWFRTTDGSPWPTIAPYNTSFTCKEQGCTTVIIAFFSVSLRPSCPVLVIYGCNLVARQCLRPSVVQLSHRSLPGSACRRLLAPWAVGRLSRRETLGSAGAAWCCGSHWCDFR